MHLPDGIMWVIIIWILAALVFWHLYRYSNAFGRRRHLCLQLLAAAAALGTFGFLRWSESHRRPGVPPRLVIFPMTMTSGNTTQITWRSLGLAQMTSENLLRAANTGFHVIPPAAILDIAEFDSLTDAGYLTRFSALAGYKYFGIGAWRDFGHTATLDFRFYESGNPDPLVQLHLAPAEDDLAANRKIATPILDRLHPVTEASGLSAIEKMPPSARQAFFEGQFFLATKNPTRAYKVASEQLRSDSSAMLFVELLAAAGMKSLATRNASRLEWQDSLAIWIPLLRRASKQDSLRATTARLLGQAYVQQEKWHAADMAFQRAFRLQPREGELLAAVSYLHPSRYAAYGFKSALELCRFALDLNPADVTAALHAADHLFYEHRARDAIRLLEDMQKISPRHFDLLMALGKYYIATHQHLKVLEVSEKLLERQPANADIYYNLGIAYYDSEDDDNAIQFFERAIALNNHRNARLYLAYIYEKRSDTTAAIRYLRERVRLREGETDLYADEAGKHLYKLLRARGELPPHKAAVLRPPELIPDSLGANFRAPDPGTMDKSNRRP